MKRDVETKISEAFNSMLRADYIALTDVDKLQLLEFYYVDQFGHLDQVLARTDQLLVGRRGTGKTTLLYRAFVECMNSWSSAALESAVGSRTLGIYIDLSKCSSLDDNEAYEAFEHAFVTEMYEAIREQLHRFWPTLSDKPNLIARVFTPSRAQRAEDTTAALAEIAELLRSGLPRVVRRMEQR